MTSDISRYYTDLNRGLPAKKPELEIPAGFRDLVSKISDSKLKGRSRVTTSLLEVSYESMEKILAGLNKIQSMTDADARDHDLTLVFRKPTGRGFTFMSTRSCSREFWSRAEGYCLAKKYITKCDEWILIIEERSSDGVSRLDFRTYIAEWQYDTDFDTVVQPMRDKSIEHHLEVNRRIGRNETCPCGSGIKYKKCCGSNYR